jgi:hypothetical protein
MYGWKTLPSNVSSDGKYIELTFVNEFRETFHLGTWGCKLEPVTVAAGIKRNLMENQNQQEAVSVPYQIWFRMKVKQYNGFVAVETSLDERIDPHNEVGYLRSGHFRAPSLLDVRVSVSQATLREHLHAHCRENIPTFQQWFDSAVTQAVPQIAAAVSKLRAAQSELQRVSGELQQLG